MSNSNCGPHPGNDVIDLTATLGGYGYDLYDATTAPNGWVELDNADVLGSGITTTSGLITGTGWGGTSGTFSLRTAWAMICI